MAKVDGREYTPGGAAEVDELMDLFAIWKQQDDQRPKGGGVDPSAAALWAADSFEAKGAK